MLFQCQTNTLDVMLVPAFFSLCIKLFCDILYMISTMIIAFAACLCGCHLKLGNKQLCMSAFYKITPPDISIVHVHLVNSMYCACQVLTDRQHSLEQNTQATNVLKFIGQD